MTTASVRRTYRLAEVARQLGVDTSTVSRWAADGRLTSIRVGGVVLIRPEDLEQFLAAHAEGDQLAPRRAQSTRKRKPA